MQARTAGLHARSLADAVLLCCVCAALPPLAWHLLPSLLPEPLAAVPGAGGSGTLTLTQRSWADALRQRWS